ncbi:hypothetical protein UFOVP449_221 [uncultured Caudovirales phage]|uniref:Uncharacterized protein n=1 Tax=uncultured Caudovirales phage TaxID=2100421 RepID=A0A6J5MEU5_9CAUD|nr:hypothetical protein UFOVP449_221 [uncultured Caudovirales phage]
MQYRKKPIVIDAIKLENLEVLNLMKIQNFVGLGLDVFEVLDDGLLIETLEGKMKASIGDYIIKGVKGEFYPCKPDIFEMNYELASTSSQTEISEPNPQLIESMCYRYSHSFGFLDDNHKESIRTTMRQLWEEVVGKGFYKQTEISDEDIEKFAFEKYHEVEDSRWFEPLQLGAKWYREQLKKKP